MRKYERGKVAENYALCVAEVYKPPNWIDAFQCSRPRGHGPGGEYCKQHGKIEATRRAREQARKDGRG